MKFNLKETKKRVLAHIEAYNAQLKETAQTLRAELGKKGGAVKDVIYATGDLDKFFYKLLTQQAHKIKKYVYRVTRSFLASPKFMGRSEPFIDRMLNLLQKAGIILRKSTAVNRFKEGDKAINCIEFELNPEYIVATIEEAKNVALSLNPNFDTSRVDKLIQTVQAFDWSKPEKNEKTRSFS